MVLRDLCATFDLSINILQKHDTLMITSTNVLQFIINQPLVEFGGMNIGELADVQEALEYWSYGHVNDPDHQGG
jgi:hypothetical protein